MLSLSKVRSRVVVLLILLALLVLLPAATVFPAFGSLKAEAFADPAMQQVWERSDKAVAEGKAVRTWLWGPQPNATRQEAYIEAPGGQRLVQFFDKSRMELTNPAGNKSSQWYITNGLLTKELVTGQVQTGDNSFEKRSPSEIPVGGDPGNPGPTYASFSKLISLNGSNRAAPKSSASSVSESIDRAGTIGQASADSANLARYAYFEPSLGHNIPDVFWNWMQKLDEQWVFAMGLPISEPYWAKFTVGGSERELLVQLFERRVLTYNASNAPQWQVEMGNIGQHYYDWRYNPGTSGTPSPVAGGSGNGTATPGSNPASGTPTATPVAGPTPTPGSGSPTAAGVNDEEKKFIDLLNQYRTANKVPELKVDEKLQQAARWLSEDMAKVNYFGHIDSQGRNYPKRLADFGYLDKPVDENIAAGVLAQTALDVWKDSPGYNAIMLNPEYKAIGVGFASNDKATYKYYWTTTFGSK